MKRLLQCLALTWGLAGCESNPEPSEPAIQVETLPEMAGAPTSVVDGRLTCLGKAPAAATAGALELTGYVRTLADPEAKLPPPAAKVGLFTADGTELASGFADAAKAGRVSISVPVKAQGFEGYALVQQQGFLDWRFQTSRPVTTTDLTGWAWLTTQGEVDTRAKALGFTLKASAGILVGAVHDCDSFGAANAVVVVGDAGGNPVYYVEGFDLVAVRPYTSTSGRFVAANLAPGTVQVKAFGRTKVGGPLELLSSARVVIEAGRITAVDLAPRTGIK